ncbi:hypothetical protein ACNKHK_19810 [Shigella flexneri]
MRITLRLITLRITNDAEYAPAKDLQVLVEIVHSGSLAPPLRRWARRQRLTKRIQILDPTLGTTLLAARRAAWR